MFLLLTFAGIIDPIEAMSELALKHDVGLHVDCCLGGFLVPFISKIKCVRGLAWLVDHGGVMASQLFPIMSATLSE